MRGPLSGVGGLSCSPFLFLSWKLVALLLGDKETQLSLAAALDGTLASIVPVFTSGANVSPRAGLLDPPLVPPSPRASPRLLSQAGATEALPLDRWVLPLPLLISFLI